MEKICKKCNINKNINEYQKDIRGKFGVESKCKNCRNIYLKKYKDKTNYDKIYYENNKENIIKKQKLYVKNNKENYNKYQNIYKKSNGYKSQKLYNSKNKEILLKKSYTRRNNKVKKDISYKLRLRISTDICNRLKKILKNKISTSLEYLGCDFIQYKTYLESLFYPEMTWDNWGKIWEIDHIKPISKFNLTIEKNIFKAFNYQNTQPLFKTTKIAESLGYINQIGNRNKSNKI
jgi:hypothetical protein